MQSGSEKQRLHLDSVWNLHCMVVSRPWFNVFLFILCSPCSAYPELHWVSSEMIQNLHGMVISLPCQCLSPCCWSTVSLNTLQCIHSAHVPTGQSHHSQCPSSAAGLSMHSVTQLPTVTLHLHLLIPTINENHFRAWSAIPTVIRTTQIILETLQLQCLWLQSRIPYVRIQLTHGSSFPILILLRHSTSSYSVFLYCSAHSWATISTPMPPMSLIPQWAFVWHCIMTHLITLMACYSCITTHATIGCCTIVCTCRLIPSIVLLRAIKLNMHILHTIVTVLLIILLIQNFSLIRLHHPSPLNFYVANIVYNCQHWPQLAASSYRWCALRLTIVCSGLQRFCLAMTMWFTNRKLLIII